MLVDSSVWVPYLRGDDTAEVGLLVRALKRADPVWIAPPIFQEVLQGADRPERFAKWDRVLGGLPMLTQPDPCTAAREAARLYARCRWAGRTPRSANDCLIAVYAMTASMPLLQHDRDFAMIVDVEPRLMLVSASP